jgi:glycosyltransferase involved in cell wall biosynthesis
MTVRVLPWPYWTGNPYLPRFCAALELGGVDVVRARVRPLGLLRLRRGDWVHFHWPGDPLIARDRARYQRRVDRFVRRLDRLRARGVRLAWTAHNLVPHDDPHPEVGRRARLELVARLDHVLVHFAGAAPLVERELGWRGPVTVIPHGHYADDYAAPGDAGEARRALELPRDGLVLLLLGCLRPYKGIAEAIAAFRRIARDDDRLILAGRPEGDIGRELALGDGDPRIVVRAERVPAREVGRYHDAADAFVMAHRATFTSGSAVMALSLGCPIVAAGGPHLATLGPEPRVFTADALADAIERRRAHGRIDRAAIRSWARGQLSWWTAGGRAAEVFRSPS